MLWLRLVLDTCTGRMATRGFARSSLTGSRKHIGEDCIMHDKSGIMLKLEPMYKEDEADFVMPWKSNPLKNYVELTNQFMGFRKLVFLRMTSSTPWPRLL